ncbi:hypothetical protein RPC_3931 [Rhodopseudomonas palustris BisB18]|uniref:Uncharacterized protein n=2 Tax=Rhodopseudomonas palustris TaxID=1076 RepID=Q20ZH9_RHOPB
MIFSPKILILEDVDQAQELLRLAFLSENIAEDNLFVAGTVKKAQSLMRDHHFHGISIDQRLPMDEQGAVIDDHGLAFTELNKWPLTKKVIYTSFGKINFANRAGFAGAEYRERAHVSDGGNKLSVYDYAVEFVRDLREHYVEKSLFAASQLLPHTLALPALKASDAKKANNWADFFRNFSELRERLMKLTLGVTLAAVGKRPPWKNGLRAQEIEDALRQLWRPVPFALRRFVSSPGWEPGEALFESLISLRKLRNAVEHHDRGDYVAIDYQDQHANIVAIVDLLAFYCELPLMHGLRFHPSRRGLLSFQRLGPNKALQDGIWEADFDPPRPDDSALYIPWRNQNGPELLQLSPWLTARRSSSFELEFHLLIGTKPEPL